MLTLGLDTSNYATSLAVFDTRAGEVVCDCKRFLPVRPGQLGLRQSDAVFHHTAALPELLEELGKKADLTCIEAVGVFSKAAAGRRFLYALLSCRGQCRYSVLRCTRAAACENHTPARASGCRDVRRQRRRTVWAGTAGLSCVGRHHRSAAFGTDRAGYHNRDFDRSLCRTGGGSPWCAIGLSFPGWRTGQRLCGCLQGRCSPARKRARI